MSSFRSDLPEGRQRSSRASERQKNELVKYFEDHPDAIRIVSGAISDQKTKQRIWIELAHKLNMIEGTLKTSSKWSKYWNDIVIYTKNRAKNAAKCMANGELKYERPPTDIDCRLLKIVGQDHLLKEWQRAFQIKFQNDDILSKQENLDVFSDEENECEGNDYSFEDFSMDDPLHSDGNKLPATNSTIELESTIPEYNEQIAEITQNEQLYNTDEEQEATVDHIENNERKDNLASPIDSDINRFNTRKRKLSENQDVISSSQNFNVNDLAPTMSAVSSALNNLAAALHRIADVLAQQQSNIQR